MTTQRSTAPGVDGRHARRERGRAAVIDAVFEILQEGRVPPPINDVAARAGVSVSSIFRYFDGLDDMQHQALVQFGDRFGHLFEIPRPGGATLPARITAFVDARITLYEAAGSIMAVARLRALDHASMATAAVELRARLAEQTASHFDREASSVTPARRSDLIALVDSLTSPDAWDVMRRGHERTRRQIRRAWIHALTGLLAQSDGST